MATSRQDLIDGLIAARARHAQRSWAARAVQTGSGLVLLVVSAPLALVLPELGVPGLLIALRLLADEFDWAARGYATVFSEWERFRTWLASRPPAVKLLVVAGMSILALVILVLVLA